MHKIFVPHARNRSLQRALSSVPQDLVALPYDPTFDLIPYSIPHVVPHMCLTSLRVLSWVSRLEEMVGDWSSKDDIVFAWAAYVSNELDV